MALPNLAQPAGLQLEEREQAGLVVLRVRGELDLSTAPLLCRAIHPATPSAPPRRMAIDLRMVGFCDSTGLRALLGAAREVEVHAGAVAIIVSEGDGIDRTLALAGVREFLPVARSLDEARSLLGMS